MLKKACLLLSLKKIYSNIIIITVIIFDNYSGSIAKFYDFSPIL